MAASTRPLPSTRAEEEFWSSGCRVVAGVDEAGRGPLAGPVFAAAVILDPKRRAGWLDDVRDSKLVIAPERERLAEAIQSEALDCAVGWSSVGEIDAWGIGAANKIAMVRAINGLRYKPEVILIDGPLGVNYPIPQKTIIGGDATCCTIAAASIVAKVARDAVMCRLDALYPVYNFAANKGYATRDHLESLSRHGACIQHRRSWLGVQRRAAEAGLHLADVSSLEAVDAAR